MNIFLLLVNSNFICCMFVIAHFLQYVFMNSVCLIRSYLHCHNYSRKSADLHQACNVPTYCEVQPDLIPQNMVCHHILFVLYSRVDLGERIAD